MKKYLVIIDVQNDFIDESKISGDVNKIEDLLKYNLQNHLFDEVIAFEYKFNERQDYEGFIDMYEDDYEDFDLDDCKIKENILKYTDEIFYKFDNSCYTDEFINYLTDTMKKDQIELYFCGLETDCCVKESILDFYYDDYNVNLLKDYCFINGSNNRNQTEIDKIIKLIGRQDVLTSRQAGVI